MQALILKLQADVEARKQSRLDLSAAARVALIRRALAIGFSIKELARVFREKEQGGAPCRKVRAIVAERLSRIDAELASLETLKLDLTGLLREWDAKLAQTPDRQQAKLLESMPLSRRGARSAK